MTKEVVVLAGSVFLAACSSGAGEPSSVPSESISDPGAKSTSSVAAAEREIKAEAKLATVRFSPTHTVEFYRVEPGVHLVLEELHVDRDKPTEQPIASAVQQEGSAPLEPVELYRALTRDDADPAIENVL